MALFNVARGNKPASIAGLDANTVYFFTDTKEIYLGTRPFGGDLAALESAIGSLESWQTVINEWKNGDGNNEGAEARIGALETRMEDFEDLDTTNIEVLSGITSSDISAWNAAEANATAVANAKVANVTASDNSITVTDSGSSANGDVSKGIAVKLNQAQDNAIQLTQTGLKVEIPAQTDYTVQVNTLGASSDYAQRYQIMQGAGNGTEVAVINIPKDMVVQSGTVVTLNATDEAGHTAGTYLKLVLANASDDEIWIPVDDLIEYVTSGSASGDQIMVNVDANHQITATLSDGSVTKAQLAQAVQDSLDLADSAMQSIEDGSITKAKLATAVQDSLDAADSALQAADITEGATNGTIAVDGTDVAVHGLGTAAYTASTAYATAAQGALADTALQSADIAEGSTNGTISVDSTDVAVHGLGTAAYENVGAFATAAQGTNADNAITALTWIELEDESNSGD